MKIAEESLRYGISSDAVRATVSVPSLLTPVERNG